MFPDTVESCRTISISDFKEWGFLKYSQTSTITWSRAKRVTAEIDIYSYVESDNPRITLSYTVHSRSGEKERFNYSITLERFPSNLGIGYRYYFRCPFTGLRCLKLYMPPAGDVFAHRSHWKNLMYDCQLETGPLRGLNDYIKTHREYQDVIRKPYLKTHYRGKPTSTMKRILRLERKSILFAERMINTI